MIPKLPRFLLVAALSFGLAPLAAEAGGTSGRISLSLSLGVYSPVRLGNLVPLPQTADVPDVEVRLDPASPEAGFCLGYRIGRRLELQVEELVSRAEIIDDVGIGFAGIPLGEVTVSKAVLWSWGVRLLYSFRSRGMEPFIAAGVGLTTLDTAALGARSSPSIDFGAGLRARFSESLRAVVEVRDTLSFFRYFQDFRILYAMIYTAESRGVQHRPSLRLGLSYIF